MLLKPTFWVSKPDENLDGILQAYVIGANDIPFPIEMHNVAENCVTFNEEQKFELVLECAEVPEIYGDEQKFYDSVKHGKPAAQSIIPIGLFPSSADKEFEPSPLIYLNGRVTDIFETPEQIGFDESDILFSLDCLGNEFDCVLRNGQDENIKIQQGNIVGGVFYVQGWPADE